MFRTSTIGLYVTKNGKEGIRLFETIWEDGRRSYRWTGSFGAGSGSPLADYLEEIKRHLARRRGVQVVVDAHEYAQKNGLINAKIKPLHELKVLWAKLGNVPTIEGGQSERLIEEPFQHFEALTPCDAIWRWFEAQNPEFRVGDLMNKTG